MASLKSSGSSFTIYMVNVATENIHNNTLNNEIIENSSNNHINNLSYHSAPNLNINSLYNGNYSFNSISHIHIINWLDYFPPIVL